MGRPCSATPSSSGSRSPRPCSATPWGPLATLATSPVLGFYVCTISWLHGGMRASASQFVARGCGVAGTAEADEARRGQQRAGRHRQQPRRGIRGRA